MANIFSVPLKLLLLLGSLLPGLSSRSVYVDSYSGTTRPSTASPSHLALPIARTDAGTHSAKNPVGNQHRQQASVASRSSKLSPDPIRFSIQCDKRQIRIDEEINLTVTVQMLNITQNQLFFVPGSNAYTLKMILPSGFEQTGGDNIDYVSGNLTSSSQPVVYHIRGRFRSVTSGTSFRLLRSHGQATDQSLFAEKSTITLQEVSSAKALTTLRQSATEPVNSSSMTLYVVTDNAATQTARAAAPEYQGFLDYAACDAVSGWIANLNDLHTSQEVDIYINGVKVANVVADQVRLDVANTLGAKDFNQFGYVWVIPDYYKANVPLTLSVRPAETSQDLTMSPRRTAVCPGTGTSPVSTTTAPPNSTTTTAPPSTTVTPPVTTTTTPPPTTTSPPPTGGALTVLAPTYNCTTGAITFNTSGGDGTTIRYRATGITGWTTDPNQYLDQGSRVNNDTPPFMIYVEQSGRTLTYTWSRQEACSGTPPSTTPPTTTPPPPTGGALTVLAPTYNCTTGAITFNTSGGDGTTIRYRATGITGWTTDPNQYLDQGSRVNNDTPPFMIYVEQSGRTLIYTWSRQAACSGAPTVDPTLPPTTAPTSPTSSAGCVSSISSISYGWDGGNYSISIRVNASSGAPQIKLGGSANFDWTNTTNVGNSTWFWANQGMVAGSYTLSVRQAGDTGVGCSFSFSVPGSGQQLYPAPGGTTNPTPGCTPPPAPTVSTSGGTQVCNNSSITLTATGCSGTVNWSGGQTGSSISVNTAGTYTATCSVNGCTSAPSSQLTVTTCTPASNARYNRVLYVGNSITLHGGNAYFIVNEQNPKRGMAATSPDKDYVHLMSAKHREQNPSVENRTLASWNLGGQLDEATGPYWEGQSTKSDIDLGRFDPVAAWKPDIIYIRLGENVADAEITNPSLYQNRLKALIDKLISQSPGAKVVLSTAVWDRPNYDAAIRAVGAERNYPVADFSNMWPNRLINGYYALGVYGDSGTNNHPDDDGMAHIADGLWNVTPR